LKFSGLGGSTNLSNEATRAFFEAAWGLLEQVFEQFERENPEQAAELGRRVAAGTPIALTVLANRDGPISCSVKAPDGAGGTVEIARLEAVGRAEH
jgi:hypothetical protein